MPQFEEPDCPRFQKCNASLCPLMNWRQAHYRSGESICKYLNDSQKVGAYEKYADDPVFAQCVGELPEIIEKYPDIGKRVENSGKTGFRGAHFTKKKPNGPQ